MFDGKPSVPTPHRNNPAMSDTAGGQMLLNVTAATLSRPPPSGSTGW